MFVWRMEILTCVGVSMVVAMMRGPPQGSSLCRACAQHMFIASAAAVPSSSSEAFHEPLDYLPTKRWYERLVGVDTTGPLRIGRDVDAVSGATLSARAATASVRRMLAYHRLLLRPASEVE